MNKKSVQTCGRSKVRSNAHAVVARFKDVGAAVCGGASTAGCGRARMEG